jgi:hypothetical protein
LVRCRTPTETDSGVDFAYSGTTDEDGWMRIDGHEEGSFTVQFSKDKYSIVTNYTLDKLTPNVTIDSVALAKPGTIKGRVDLPDSAKVRLDLYAGYRKGRKRLTARAPSPSATCPPATSSSKAWVPKYPEVHRRGRSVRARKRYTRRGNVSDTTDEIVFKRTMKINPRELISSWMRPLPIPTVLILRLDSTFNFFETTEDGSDCPPARQRGQPAPHRD